MVQWREVRQSVEQPRVPAVFAVTAYKPNAQWVSLTVQGMSDRLQPSELAVGRDLELSTRFTYCD